MCHEHAADGGSCFVLINFNPAGRSRAWPQMPSIPFQPPPLPSCVTSSHGPSLRLHGPICESEITMLTSQVVVRVKWTVKCLVQWLTYNRFPTNVCSHSWSVFCTLGFSTRVRIQRGKGFCAKRCWLAVLSHLGSFHKEVGGWKISKHIHFTAGESRQYGDRGLQPRKRAFRP